MPKEPNVHNSVNKGSPEVLSNTLLLALDEKTDLHHICAVQMWASLVQSRSKCGANGVRKYGANPFFRPVGIYQRIFDRLREIVWPDTWLENL